MRTTNYTVSIDESSPCVSADVGKWRVTYTKSYAGRFDKYPALGDGGFSIYVAIATRSYRTGRLRASLRSSFGPTRKAQIY